MRPVAFARDDDPRRVGIGALMLGCFYVAVLFITKSLVFRAVVMLLTTGAVLAIAARIRLPRWREAEARKRVAMRAMVAEALIIGAAATILRLVIS